MMTRPSISFIIIQVVGWLLFFAFLLTFVSHMNNGQDFRSLFKTEELWTFVIIYVGAFYLNYALLFPQLYLKRRFFLYFLIFIALLIAVFFLRPYDNLLHNFAALESGPHLSFGESITESNEIGSAPIKRGPKIDTMSVAIFILLWTVGCAGQLIRQWKSVQEKAARAEAEKAKAELAFLKAQINPHFLFNTLNNIYSLALSNSENTANAIMKLSTIMRYVTDEVSNDFVPLTDETKLVSDYIELQRLRLSKKVTIDYRVTGDIESKRITPLILIPFVENVFKYGISNHDPSTIAIHLNALPDSIEFFCQNRIFNQNRNLERQGIGIENTRKRLELVYDRKQCLEIDKQNGLYTVKLKLHD